MPQPDNFVKEKCKFNNILIKRFMKFYYNDNQKIVMLKREMKKCFPEYSGDKTGLKGLLPH